MTQMSLWGEDFDIKEPDTKKILEKVRKPKIVKEVSLEKKLKSKIVSVPEKIELIKSDVYRILGDYKDQITCIRDYDSLVHYFDKIIENGSVALDTETNNTLNTFDCKLMGLCLYTPGMKAAYVPVNHCEYKLDEDGSIVLLDKVDNQLTEQQIQVQLQRLLDNHVFEIYHNATFDIEVLKTTCGVKLKCDWDTQSGALVLNENELKGLKMQYKLHCDPEEEKYDIEHLFKGLPYAIFDPELFAFYAAVDSLKTYRLFEYQKEQFELPENKEIYNLFKEIEIPILDVIVDMELTGVCVDLDYDKKMSKIYHERADEVQTRVDAELEKLKPIIDAWKLTPEANEKKRVYPAKKTKMSQDKINAQFPLVDEKGKRYKMGKSSAEQLSDPIDVGSPTQLKVLLYEILKVPVVDKMDPTGTGADILKELSKKYNICELLLEKRGVEILINTFIDAIPTFVQKDGKIHARFNSTGTQTGRFSSTEPNLQQIPSHDKSIRMIFKAPSGYSIVGSDYSSQEPRSTASLAHDEEMLKAFSEGKDLYATIGSKVFHNNYWDNLEFDQNGILQPDGKERRSKAKTVLLGITYGMSAHTLAENMELSQEEAEKIIEDFYKGFPGVKKLTDDSQEMLQRVGYVTDMWGRRRHLPDAQLPEFEVKPDEKYKNNFEFNPLIGAKPHEDKQMLIKIKSYQDKLSKAKWKKDIEAITLAAKKDGLIVKDNRGFINRAKRQCLNARIQGTAASMTKKAMIMIYNDEELNRLGFKLLITVHDEVFGQCPTENSKAAAKRLSEVMVATAADKCICKFKCDPYICVDG
jgi:DNA polymerase I